MQTCHIVPQRISLRKLLPAADLRGADDMAVTGCACDSRRVEPGDLFAVIPGQNEDGRDFIAEAIARGCSALLTEQSLDCAVPVCRVTNVRDAYARICQALAGDPSHALKLIGVTGTNGKTTTTWLISSILAAAGHPTGMLGTLGYFDGERTDAAPWTTPPAGYLADLLSRMVGNGCTHAVMEVSSHALDQSRVSGVRFDTACVTNVRRDHLDYHSTIEDYRLAKSKLFRHLAPEGVAVINADDPTSAGYLSQIERPVLTVGVRSAAELTGILVEQHASEQTFLLCAGSDTIPVRTRMIGLHHVYNCLSAAAVGLAYGIDLPTIIRGLEAVESVPGRLERIECGQPFSVYVDFAHTPDALAAALKTLREVTPGRVICVFGAEGDRDRTKRPLMGRMVERYAHQAVITSDNTRNEDAMAIIREILGGFQNPREAEIVADRATAIHWALGGAQPGDCVLIAGKGHETHQIIGQQRIPFDDREVAREWLYSVKPFAEKGN